MSLTNITHYTNLLFIADMTQTFCSMTIDPGPIDRSVLTEQVKHRSELLWNPGRQVIVLRHFLVLCVHVTTLISYKY